MTAIEDGRAALETWQLARREGLKPWARGDALFKALSALIAEHEPPTAPPTDDEREALEKTLAPLLWHSDYAPGIGDKGDYATDPRNAAQAVFAAGFRRQGPITDEDVHTAYRGFCEARKGAPLADGEYEAVFSRVEFAWIRATLEAARGA
jgi:hypothetical protein